MPIDFFDHSDLPWRRNGARVFAANGEEILVATRSSPTERKRAEGNAALVERAVAALVVLHDLVELIDARLDTDILRAGSTMETARAILGMREERAL